MKPDSIDMRKFYASQVDQEWERLFKNSFNHLEWENTWRYLEKYLPNNGIILDAGGGPGRYSLELAARGHRVVLFDLTPENLARARFESANRLLPPDSISYEEGSLLNLSRFPDNTFSAVLCTGGPLSHIDTLTMRQQAASELVRVASPGAPIFVSVMSRYGLLLATSSGWPQIVSRFKPEFDRIIANGDCYAFGSQQDGYCHFFTAKELKILFQNCPVKFISQVGLEGLNYKETALAFSDQYPRDWQTWLDINRQIDDDPFVVNASNHMLLILKKSTGK
jgi:SAM-dependent methyltransferase